jgi:phage FluMu protein Com
MKVRCTSCQKLFSEETVMTHIFGECKLPKSKKGKDRYWKQLVKVDMWKFLKKVKEGEAVLNFPESNLTDLRCGLILFSLGLVELPGQHGMTPEAASYLIAASAPVVFLHMAEFAGVIDVDGNGIISLSKKEEMRLQDDAGIYR